MRCAIVILAVLAMVGCAPKKAETKAPLTEHQRDSVLATEPLPGASTVGAAMKASDRASADAAKMNAQVDSASH
jgi:hypothetical protein